MSRVSVDNADDLPERVDAGVGAAGGGHAHRLLRELAARSASNVALHRRLIGLNLPAGIRACRRRHGQLEPASGH